jgi:penicillin-binding protein A
MFLTKNKILIMVKIMTYKKIILIALVILLFYIIGVRIIDLKAISYQKYYTEYLNKANNVIKGEVAPRGRILDTNGQVIVDNVPINNIIYRHLKGISTSNEIKIAETLSTIINDIKEPSLDNLKDYYLLTHNTDNLLSSDELELFKYRKLSADDLIKLKKARLDPLINNYTIQDKKVISLYYLMQVGYNADNKIIAQDVTDELCAKITELNVKGLTCNISFKRVNYYPMIDSIIGSIGAIPADKINDYLSLDYALNDKVGISGLEAYYETYLKGTKAEYQVNNDNSLTMLKKETKGPDLTLSIDVDLETKSYEILQEHLNLAKSLSNTDYYKEAFILIGSPKTGDIVSILGLRRNDDDTFSEISRDALLTSFTVGSVVKGASQTVGYLNNLIAIGKNINDACVKLYNVPEKCSFKRLGMINDITALKMSSNYYQFMTAIKSTGNKYYPNIKITVDESNFNKYRDVFKLYGLGASTGIDYPSESTGITGKLIAPDLLLNLAIGQYDTYTPLQMLTYINTIANNGKRLSLSFKKQDNPIISEVNLDKEYMERIQEGFYEVVNSGTGRGYTDRKYNAVGKTGTAESFYQKGIITITQSYIMYAPRDDPKYSIVVVNPNLSYNNSKNNYIAPINRLISKSISNYLLANY